MACITFSPNATSYRYSNRQINKTNISSLLWLFFLQIEKLKFPIEIYVGEIKNEVRQAVHQQIQAKNALFWWEERVAIVHPFHPSFSLSLSFATPSPHPPALLLLRERGGLNTPTHLPLLLLQTHIKTFIKASFKIIEKFMGIMDVVGLYHVNHVRQLPKWTINIWIENKVQEDKANFYWIGSSVEGDGRWVKQRLPHWTHLPRLNHGR